VARANAEITMAGREGQDPHPGGGRGTEKVGGQQYGHGFTPVDVDNSSEDNLKKSGNILATILKSAHIFTGLVF